MAMYALLDLYCPKSLPRIYSNEHIINILQGLKAFKRSTRQVWHVGIFSLNNLTETKQEILLI